MIIEKVHTIAYDEKKQEQLVLRVTGKLEELAAKFPEPLVWFLAFISHPVLWLMSLLNKLFDRLPEFDEDKKRWEEFKKSCEDFDCFFGPDHFD